LGAVQAAEPLAGIAVGYGVDPKSNFIALNVHNGEHLVVNSHRFSDRQFDPRLIHADLPSEVFSREIQL
jgi:hypothetical protein